MSACAKTNTTRDGITAGKRALLVGVVASLLVSGCTSTSGSKFRWPWSKQTTVPSSPGGIYDPPGEPPVGADPFLPPVPPGARGDGPASSQSHSPRNRELDSEATVKIGQPQPISLVSGRVRENRASPDPFVASQDPLRGVSAPRREFKYIVLHESLTPTGNLREMERRDQAAKGREECGYHFVVGNGKGSADGAIQASDRWFSQKHGAHLSGNHVEEYNLHGIGICLIGDFHKAPPTDRQLQATRQLVSTLMNEYQIPSYRVLTRDEIQSTGDIHASGPASLFRIETVLSPDP